MPRYVVVITQTNVYEEVVDSPDLAGAKEDALEKFHYRWKRNELAPIDRDRPSVYSIHKEGEAQ